MPVPPVLWTARNPLIRFGRHPLAVPLDRPQAYLKSLCPNFLDRDRSAHRRGGRFI